MRIKWDASSRNVGRKIQKNENHYHHQHHQHHYHHFTDHICTPPEHQHIFHPRSTPALGGRASESLAPQRYGQMFTWSLQTNHRDEAYSKVPPGCNPLGMPFEVTIFLTKQRVDCKLPKGVVKSHVFSSQQFSTSGLWHSNRRHLGMWGSFS